MSYPTKQVQKQYTYGDYLKLPDNQRHEVIEGVLAMVPSPSTEHQKVAGKLYLQIANYLKSSNNCHVFFAPYDVLLSTGNEEIEEDIRTVVQPDILIVCDEKKITDKNCVGPPDLIIEIVSPASPSRDYVKKLNLYEKYKVKEYWIVNYLRKDVLVYRLQQNKEYKEPEIYFGNNEIRVGLFEDLIINLKEVFI